MLSYSNKIALESFFVSSGLSGDTVSATGNGTSFDRETVDELPNGPYEDGFLLVEVEAISGGPTAVNIKLRLEESADGVTFTPVTDLSKVGAETVDFTGVGIKTLAFRLPGLKRYVRAARSTVTFTGGTSPSAKVRATFVLTNGRQV